MTLKKVHNLWKDIYKMNHQVILLLDKFKHNVKLKILIQY